MNLRTRFRLSTALALGITGLALAASPASAQGRGSYSYIRTLDGSATVVQSGGTRERAEINQPILAGDRLWVANGSRVELVLSDRSLVHVAGGTEIAFDALALSRDDSSDYGSDRNSDRGYDRDSDRYSDRNQDRSSDRDRDRTSDRYSNRGVKASVLRLLEGEIRVGTDNFPHGVEPPQVETGNATVYLGAHGSFRLISERDGWSEVTVREGSAEIATERGSKIVRERQTAEIDGVSRARVEIRPAVGRDGLERWAENLLDRADSYQDRYVDDDLRYSSEPLSRYGSWTTVDRRQVWRPRVAPGWRPYSLGRWRNSPGGSIWISSEPWGWVPYHYGTWDYFPGVGWGWIPGRVFAPAWVYWYWGPSHVGWCPVGYYTRYYGGSGFRDGLYGWAHGSGSFFAEWNFVPFGRYGDRDLGRHIRRGRDLGISLGRGIVTTDTRPLGRERWSDPTRAIEILRRGRPDLPDVSDFVARKRDLPPAVRREIAIDRERPGDELYGTPMRPGTLGGGADGAAPGAPGGRTADTPRGRTRWNPNGGEVEGQPAEDTRRGNEPRGGVVLENGRETGRETGRGSGRDSGLDTGRDSGVETGRDSGLETGRDRSNRNDRTGGDTPADGGVSVERRRPSSPPAREENPEPGPYSGQPAEQERRHPTYPRSERDDEGDSNTNSREAEPPPARERVGRERPSYIPPADAPAEPPPSTSRHREAPSSPPQEEAKPRQQQNPDAEAERPAPRNRRSQDRERPAESSDDGEAGSPPPGG